MKEFLANKNRDHEIRIHEYEADLIKNNEKIKVEKFSNKINLYFIQEMSDNLKIANEKEKIKIAEKIENDSKIKLLSKEVLFLKKN